MRDKVKNILLVFATVVIPILSWEPVASFLEKLFSESSLSLIWNFLTKPYLSIGKLVWIILFGLLIFKLCSSLLKKDDIKKKRFISSVGKNFNLINGISAKIEIEFEGNQPIVSSCVFHCTKKDYSQAINYYERKCNAVIDNDCRSCCLSTYTAYDNVYNTIRSELLKRWNNFK